LKEMMMEMQDVMVADGELAISILWQIAGSKQKNYIRNWKGGYVLTAFVNCLCKKDMKDRLEVIWKGASYSETVHISYLESYLVEKEEEGGR